MAELLSLDGVTAGYGASVVLEGISLALDDGDSLALLGRNGVGKSTLLVTLMGLTRLHRGALRWRAAHSVVRRTASSRTRRGTSGCGTTSSSASGRRPSCATPRSTGRTS